MLHGAMPLRLIHGPDPIIHVAAAGRAAKSEEYLQRKEGELQARVAAAAALPQHAAVLQWQM